MKWKEKETRREREIWKKGEGMKRERKRKEGKGGKINGGEGNPAHGRRRGNNGGHGEKMYSWIGEC